MVYPFGAYSLANNKGGASLLQAPYALVQRVLVIDIGNS